MFGIAVRCGKSEKQLILAVTFPRLRGIGVASSNRVSKIQTHYTCIRIWETLVTYSLTQFLLSTENY